MPAHNHINVYCRSHDDLVPRAEGITSFSRLTPSEAAELPNLLVISGALDLPEVAEVVKAANRVKHLRALLIKQDSDPQWVTQFLDRAGLRTLRNTLAHTDAAVFRRIVNAWRLGAQDQLIADATIEGRTLFIRTCGMERLEVQASSVAALAPLAQKELGEVEVAQDGSHLHWPSANIHLDVESFRVALDPKLQTEFARERAAWDEAFGRAIRELREDVGLRQKDVDGLSARQIRRYEKGARPRLDSLRLLAEAHGMDVNRYMNQLAETVRRDQ